MTRRKFEITAHMNERNFPHIVELELPPGGFRTQSLEFEAFHREHHILIRRGRSDARQGRLSYRYQILQAPEPAAPDRLAPSRCAMRPAARQRPRPVARMCGGGGSLRPPGGPPGQGSCRRAYHEPSLLGASNPGTRKRPPSLGKLGQQSSRLITGGLRTTRPPTGRHSAGSAGCCLHAGGVVSSLLSTLAREGRMTVII